MIACDSRHSYVDPCQERLKSAAVHERRRHGQFVVTATDYSPMTREPRGHASSINPDNCARQCRDHPVVLEPKHDDVWSNQAARD